MAPLTTATPLGNRDTASAAHGHVATAEDTVAMVAQHVEVEGVRFRYIGEAAASAAFLIMKPREAP